MLFALPYVVALLLLGAMLSLPHRQRPAAGLAAAFILLLVEPGTNANGQPVAGPSTAMALLIFLAVGCAIFNGDWRNLNRPGKG